MLHILRLRDRGPQRLNTAEHSLGTGLVGKLLTVFGLAALVTVVMATMAWLSFQQVVVSHQTIVDEAIPAMESVQNLVNSNSRISAWLDQLQREQDVQEIRRISSHIADQITGMVSVLDSLQQRPFAQALDQPVHATLYALQANVQRQVEQTLLRVQIDQLENTALARQRAAVDGLLRLSEFLVANASATTTANVANLYRLIDGRVRQGQLLDALDRLVEVDIDTMERMSELQLQCSNLKIALDQLLATREAGQIPGIEARFSASLKTLKRRIDDLHDPSLQQNSRALYKALASAEVNGPFAIHRQKLAQAIALQDLVSQGSTLVSQFNEQASALATAGGKAIGSARTQSKNAVNRVFVGFLLVAVLLSTALFVTFWAVFRHHVVGRLKGMETAVRALSTGNFDVSLATSDQDPLAPLSHALEQVRRNVRERERLEQQLRQHQEALESQVSERTAELKRTNALLEHEVAEHAEARQKAEDANKAKNVFLGSLSHELRTPLSGVSGAVRLLQETGLDARQVEYLHMIDYANRTLLETLEDMLSFSRIEAGKLQLQLETFSLRDALEDMLSLQTVPARSKGIVLDCEFAPTVPRFVVGDRRKINQLLLNIIGNAIKFTDVGGVTVLVDAQDTPDPQRKNIRVAVVDTGIGIPASKCAEVFKPFFQVEDTSHRRHGGTGLGLAICQRLVQAMGGQIDLRSEEASGTCVTFNLELGVAHSLSTPLAAQSSAAVPALRPLTVLVVEDDAINRLVCTRYLELLGHRPLVAEHGDAALAVMQQQGSQVDAILMDISLPGRSGLEVTQLIHGLADGRWAGIPVIVMSAHLAAQTEAAQQAAGLAAFLSKPFTLDALAKVLGDVVPPQPVTEAARPRQPDLSVTGDGLDEAFLATEIATLGAPTLRELLAMFSDSLPAAFADMAQALNDGHWLGLGKLAHRLRSSASNLGLRSVIAATRELETAAQAETPDVQQLTALLARLQDATAQGTQALQLHLQTLAAP